MSQKKYYIVRMLFNIFSKKYTILRPEDIFQFKKKFQFFLFKKKE